MELDEISTMMSFTTVEPEVSTNSSYGEDSNILQKFDNIEWDSTMFLFLTSLVVGSFWVITSTYFISRIIGYILTKILNRFVKTGFMQVGSFTFNALSGKVMFRDLAYITNDYSVRVQDGYIIFRWWRAYVPKDVTEDLSHSDTRLSVVLNGLEIHQYNRSQLYSRLEQIFEIDPQLMKGFEEKSELDAVAKEKTDTRASRKAPKSPGKLYTWRDLIPVVKVDVFSGRMVFGNRLVPTTLSVNIEEAHFVYSTKPAASRLDHFMHFIKCKAENFKVILVPSPKYTGMVDDPPRYMGEGFVILSSNNVELYYYMDEPGFVPEEPLMLQLANGDIVESAPPIWGLDIKCGRGTDFSYGPWADRQRDNLFRFFFPNEYQPMKPSKPPLPGEKRVVQSFDIRLSTLHESTIDILFSKNRETNAVHINIGQGSYLEVTIPWVVLEDGYTTKVTGQLLHLEASTSLQYRSLVESETLEFKVVCHFPIHWNEHQDWSLSLTGCKATINFIYSHIHFFKDMVNDWSSKARPDILHFVPYTWKILLILKDFELITISNEYNWIDCSSQNQENAHVAFCGDLFDMSFELSFVDFLPPTLPLKFWIQGECVDMALYLPEVHSSRPIIMALDRNAKIMGRDDKKNEKIKRWRNTCQRSNGWVDCWSVPIVAISIVYIYHPMPPMGPPPQANITTPEKEEILLSPIRIPHLQKQKIMQQWPMEDGQRFDPMTLEPDKVTVEIEIGSSLLLLYGSVLRNFIHLKENIFGEDQTFTDMQKSKAPSASSMVGADDDNEKLFDPRVYRPLDVTVSLTLHDIQAHLVKNCGEKDPPCPVALIERIGFEMKKGYQETTLQLLVSPAFLLSSDLVPRNVKDVHLGQGHLMLSGLQVRGHAMFSDEGRSLDHETLEYAWMIEVQLGRLTGKLTAPQLYHLVTSLETFLLLALDSENCLRPPRLPRLCHHGMHPQQCPQSADIATNNQTPSQLSQCPTSDDIKYRMTRLAMDALDIFFLEASTAIHLLATPIRLSTCNLHGSQVKSGVTALLPVVQIRQFICMQGNYGTGTNRSQGSGVGGSKESSDAWLEVGSISLGPLVIEAAMSLSSPEQSLHLVQHKYLRTHDERTRKLWFLWLNEHTESSASRPVGKCGCIGGCIFFGQNVNGPGFFKPNRNDLKDGINVAAYRVNPIGADAGFGQSILHEQQLVFHTPPYTSYDIVSLQEPSSWDTNMTRNFEQGLKVPSSFRSKPAYERSSSISESKPSPANVSIDSNQSGRSLGRRFSYTPTGVKTIKDVPYTRLLDSPNMLPKLDSDSKLHNTKAALNVPETPKASSSDSKLAVEYFVPAVPPSESKHSLLSNEAEMADALEFQRTVSISSGQSEAFYSADEDSLTIGGSVVDGKKFTSETQIAETAAKPIARLTSYSSEQDITSQEAKPGEPMRSRLSPLSASVPHDIVSSVRYEEAINDPFKFPELRERLANKESVFIRTSLNALQKSGPRKLQDVTEVGDSSDSQSIHSNQSFISAMSSQEDLTMVNLHMQVNKPIIESPLLMSSYINHLSQVRCHRWKQSSLPLGCDAYTTPLFERTDDGKLTYIGGRYVPKFEMITEGFTTLKMLSRAHEHALSTPPPSSSKTPTHPYLWDNASFLQSADTSGEIEEELLSFHNDHGTRTSIIVKSRGDIDIMISPLVLESLQRFIDSITPTFAALHPLTVLNDLHWNCISRVEAANILKKEQSSYLSQLQTSKRGTAERNAVGMPGPHVALQSNVYEESIHTQTQGTIILPKVNVTLLQASIVEEIISFSALDNIRDLTCVSLFAVCLESVSAQFYSGRQAKEVVQTFHRPVVAPSGGKKISKLYKVWRGGTSPTDPSQGELVHIETSEKQQEELIVNVSVGKTHTQLRRLKNECSILKDANITAISQHQSKVMFNCVRLSPSLKTDHSSAVKKKPEVEDSTDSEDKLGFIMFECGFEGVSLKIVKKSHFERSENSEKEENMPASDPNYNESVKSKDDFDEKAQNAEEDAKDNDQEDSAQTKPGPTSDKTEENKLEVCNKDLANTSSCVLELKTVWFNFAAPPRAPITRKIDYTRLDWNLLSTASPGIDAWMNPSNRFAIKAVCMLRTMYRRSTGIVASLMAEALEIQSIHMPIKSRYSRVTPMAKTLQEDPSCQLCNVLLKYVLQTEMIIIENNLRESDLPLLSTLRQGVIVLSRQWKNVLYTPLLLEHNYKMRNVKPLNVTFAVQDTDEENILTDENSGEDGEVTDECTLLLKSPEKVSKSDTEQPDTENIFHSPASPPPKKNLPPSQPPCSSRASIVFPINSAFTSKRFENSAALFQKGSDQTLCSEKDGLQANSSSNNSLDGTVTLTSPKSLLQSENDDLYSWMAKQQDYTKAAEQRNRIRRNLESKVTTLSTEDTVHTIETGHANPAYNLYPMSNSLHLLDAHLIFEPLLSCLGVMPEQISGTNYEKLGTNISLVGAMDMMRIDIVVSEYGKTDKKKKGKTSAKSSSKFHLDIPPETPAFLCEKIGIEVDVKKMADMTVDDMIHKQNVLYISRGQLKKHTSTVVNFSLTIRYISQQVNMPLLRLLHQISNMYQNFKETQMELKEQQPELSKDKKNGSSSASEQQETNLDHVKSKSRQSLLQRTLSRTSLRSRKGSIEGGRDKSMPRSQSRGISPSASMRNRPQSFAQKLRSTGKSVRGYMNLSEGISPLFGNSPSGSGVEHGTISSDKSKDLSVPQCWKIVYGLLDLYATMPETKTITHRFSMAPETSAFYKASARKYEVIPESKEDVEKGINDSTASAAPTTPKIPDVKHKELNVLTGERTRLVVFGVARIHRTRLLATLSGLKLEAEITSLHSSLTCRKKSRPASLECSIAGQVGRTMIVLLEGVAPNQQTVVKVTVGKSQTLYSSISKRLRDKNSGLLTVGAINVDIPQHPVALHGMMTRGSKQLSSTLQELRVSRMSRLNRGLTVDEIDFVPPLFTRVSRENLAPFKKAESTIIQPLVIQFTVVLQSLSITAALLPSLQAQYKMDQVQSTGVTGSKAKFTIDLPKHSLSFTTKLQTAEANLPTAACIELPKVHVSAEYILEGSSTDKSYFADGVVLHKGGYLNASADIGVFEHSLTTDLLNHLVFVQKVFMKEVNEVLQKVYGGEKLAPLWLDDNEETQPSNLKRLLFSLIVRLKRIQLTATTPTNSAVRLETGAVEFQLSNRVLNVSTSKEASPSTKLFFKAQVDINLSLGQLLKNIVFEEAEPEFQQFAFFKTKIFLRNAFQDETGQGEMVDKEVVLIKLQRPLIYIQPMAVDKAILVWLNYKNAYEYWDEQRSNLQKEVLTATQQVFEKVPFSQISSPNLGTLFLQLTVHDMGICLPLNPLPPVYSTTRTYDESRGAVVVTLDSTSISACSSGSLVSKGKFVGLCLRFAEDFETSLDEWRPDMSDGSIMNLCVVSEGTYEVCSRTIAQKTGSVHDNAKWFLNVQWQMEGVDIHLDVNVGKQLSALGHTLTTLTGYEDDETVNLDSDSDEGDQVDGSKASQESMYGRRMTDNLPSFFFDPNIDVKTRSKLIEREMSEQTKIINDLRTLGASQATVEQELRKLQELEAAAYKDFRLNMMQKLRRQSVKASSIKGKFGLGSKSSALKTRSLIIPSPMLESQTETPSDDLGTNASFESSPQSGPSRSASIKTKEGVGPRVTFSPDTHNIYGSRQSSLPSMESDLSLPEYDIDPDVELRRKPSPSKFDLRDGPYYLEPGTSKDGGLSPMSGHSGFQKPQEPNIDFELDVKVLIKSGKCVLHTKDPSREDEIKLTKMKKERSSSGATLEYPASPNTSRKNKELKHNQSSSRLKFLTSNVTSLVDLTIFHVPGLDVKVHYESRNMNEDIPYLQRESIQFRKPSVKKASLFAWMTLQSIPEETIISPHILEFLEQTLEPIPSAIPQPKTNTSNTMFAMDLDTNMTSTVTNYAYTSFPVDVIVYFHMQPSSFRFSCLPVSRVECMLKLPSLDIVFSSKRAEGEHAEFVDEISRPAPAPGSVSGYRGSLTEAMKFDSSAATAAVGGLSVTGCLADFSVYIFHPYGGKKTGLKEAQWSPLADSERKDSLSINVEFVKFHLSRSRKLNFSAPMPDPGIKATLGSTKLGDHSQAVIRFSTIVDIGSASFKYDMRRLTEILAFPKAWYRRSIVRRLFLGDLSMSAMYNEGDDSPPSSFDEEAPSGLKTTPNFEAGASRSAPVEQSPLLMREKLRLSLESEIPKNFRLHAAGEQPTPSSSSTSPSDLKGGSAWETLVLFAVNFTKLNVHMNMGNVMGNVTWQTKDFKSEGRLSIGSNGHKNMYIGVGLGGSSLDAKGGIVGGTIELSKIDTFMHIREDPGIEPDHKFGLKLFALELRLDYMGTGVLMSRVSSLDVSLRAEWKIHHQLASSSQDVPTRRPATIFMHGDLGWDQLQLMISRSTTADLLKMFYKLEEFFSQQFKSSKRVFSSLQPTTKKPSLRKKSQIKKKSTGSSSGDPGITLDARHHRHWHRPLSAIAGLRLNTLPNPLPVSGSVLGGTMELHGNNISLACFHGINFKSKSWALFSLREPCISFATEAQEVPPANVCEAMDVHVVQSLTFSLGMVGLAPAHAQHLSMATICRMSRNSLFPPQFRTLQEWFNFAFAQSELDDVDRFPSLERERTESSERRSTKSQEINHNKEVIFSLPSMQLHLKTEHLQTARTPEVPGGDKPEVICSFITEFEDHIFVTVDAEAFFFLHDLITSYLKEKDRVVTSTQIIQRAHSPDGDRRRADSSRKTFDPAEMFLKDWRSFNCKTWHLEPTVRLLSWAGKSIEPYGVDYILQKLGFTHARTTIPKWMQRGFQDPLDKVLSLLMLRMIGLVKDESVPAIKGREAASKKE
ncbi:bridge-like lipid transfer protein family member 1 isoform X2 [Neocloeon triangulifer]|uniref:bridge-like lipid transfer protein family member 1 isoform X2 n=1 Tax=Neocloeon triangulifer TaxID=2078957 RepID=UPI00286F4484|nr:bridge-like lipid transfer protein family member 1 isoform X2 [Neocloeon triangulifer]